MWKKSSRDGVDELSDRQLLQRFRQTKHPVWLGRLYARYVELTFGLCLKYLQQEQEAEDAVSDIFEALMEKLPGQEVENFRSWLYVFAKNHCLMKIRAQNRVREKKETAERMYLAQLRHPLDEREEKEAHLKSMEACIEQLAEAQRACVELFYLKGMTYKAIAESRSENLGTTRSHIQNGRRNLRNCMEKSASRKEEKLK